MHPLGRLLSLEVILMRDWLINKRILFMYILVWDFLVQVGLVLVGLIDIGKFTVGTRLPGQGFAILIPLPRVVSPRFVFVLVVL